MSESEQNLGQEALGAKQDEHLEQLFEFLRIASVSTAEEHISDVKLAASWVAARLTKAGLGGVKKFPTGVHECVYAEWLGAVGKPTVLIYGHFDVQPADPIGLWDSNPFEPVVKDGRIYARGASDMKANLLLTILAVEEILQTTGRLPVNVKFLFEGQEEIGSRDLGPFIAAHRELLACDLVLTPDSIQWDEGQPVIFLGTKGICCLQIDLQTASLDLHSGLYGGAVPNAVHAMAELIATMHGKDGVVTVDGFYADVVPLTDAEKLDFAQVPFAPKEYVAPLGVTQLTGEPDYTTYERAWARPTLEVNGIWGGYQGEGVKTVIPAQAHAKISCRLVPNQNPTRALESIENHIRDHCPVGATVKVTRHGGATAPYLVPRDDPGVKIVAQVLSKSYGKMPYFARIGGSLPITDLFLKELQANTILMGFSQDDERMHSPNEFCRISNFGRGKEVYAELLERLGDHYIGKDSQQIIMNFI